MAKLNIVCWHLPDDFHDADHLNELGFLYIHQGQMIRRVCLQYAAIHWLRNHSETRPSFLFIQLQHQIHLDSSTICTKNQCYSTCFQDTWNFKCKLKTVFSQSVTSTLANKQWIHRSEENLCSENSLQWNWEIHCIYEY